MEQELETRKPFADPNYTMIHNDAIDYIMPALSAGAWKVLTVIIRATWGWKDETTATGRKEKDLITYDELEARTGMARQAIARAVLELRGFKKNKGGEQISIGPAYILREEAPKTRGDQQKASYFYALNTELQIELPHKDADEPKIKNQFGNQTGNQFGNQTGNDTISSSEIKLNKRKIETKVKKGSGAKRRTRDPRLDDLAIKGYREIAHLHVPIALRDDWIACAERLGVELLLSKTKEWIGNGWKPNNVNGIMDFAQNGGLYSRLGQERKGDLTDEQFQQYVEAGVIKA